MSIWWRNKHSSATLQVNLLIFADLWSLLIMTCLLIMIQEYVNVLSTQVCNLYHIIYFSIQAQKYIINIFLAVLPCSTCNCKLSSLKQGFCPYLYFLIQTGKCILQTVVQATAINLWCCRGLKEVLLFDIKDKLSIKDRKLDKIIWKIEKRNWPTICSEPLNPTIFVRLLIVWCILQQLSSLKLTTLLSLFIT